MESFRDGTAMKSPDFVTGIVLDASQVQFALGRPPSFSTIPNLNEL